MGSCFFVACFIDCLLRACAQAGRVPIAHFPPVEAELTDEERLSAALALTAALPERVFTGRYDQLMDLAAPGPGPR